MIQTIHLPQEVLLLLEHVPHNKFAVEIQEFIDEAFRIREYQGTELELINEYQIAVQLIKLVKTLGSAFTSKQSKLSSIGNHIDIPFNKEYQRIAKTLGVEIE